jgi:hypothetical protein
MGGVAKMDLGKPGKARFWAVTKFGLYIAMGTPVDHLDTGFGQKPADCAKSIKKLFPKHASSI